MTLQQRPRALPGSFQDHDFHNSAIISIADMRTPVLEASLAMVLSERRRFAYRQIVVRNGKGDEDRIVPLPQRYRDLLTEHIEARRTKPRGKAT
jgi:hypothetical protein